jgi:hypothetical protein
LCSIANFYLFTSCSLQVFWVEGGEGFEPAEEKPAIQAAGDVDKKFIENLYKKGFTKSTIA